MHESVGRACSSWHEKSKNGLVKLVGLISSASESGFVPEKPVLEKPSRRERLDWLDPV